MKLVDNNGENSLSLRGKIKSEMKRIFALSLLALASIVAFAQKPTVKFETESRDFGEIQEKEGPVSYVFKYTNTGSTPLVLTQVQASCGCTLARSPRP